MPQTDLTIAEINYLRNAVNFYRAFWVKYPSLAETRGPVDRSAMVKLTALITDEQAKSDAEIFSAKKEG